jgi:aromatic ring-opening dioxygenase catalytic subunit (LigB family)
MNSLKIIIMFVMITLIISNKRQDSIVTISSHFLTRGSHVRCKLANYIGRELRNKVRKYISVFELL